MFFRKYRSSHLEVFLRKVVLKICSKFTGGHPCWSGIWIKLQSKFIEIALRHGCSPVNLLHIFRTPFPRNTTWWLLLNVALRIYVTLAHIFLSIFFLQQCPGLLRLLFLLLYFFCLFICFSYQLKIKQYVLVILFWSM